MATMRALSGTESLSLSRSWLDYFLCCFAGSRSGSQSNTLRGKQGRPTSEAAAEDIADYGSGRSDNVHVISRSIGWDSDIDEGIEATSRRSKEGENDELDNGAPELSRSSKASISASRGSTESKTSARSKKLTHGKGGSNNHLSDDSLESHRQTQDAVDGCSESKGKLHERHSPSQYPNKSDILSGKRYLAVDQETSRREVGSNRLTNDSDFHRSAQDVRSIAGNGRNEGTEERKSSDVKPVVEDSASSRDLPMSTVYLKQKVAEQYKSDSHLFDVSDLHLDKSSSSSACHCGSVRLTFVYSGPREKMSVTVHEAQDIPTQARGGASQTQVRMLLLPGRKIRQKTKIKPGENPQFQEAFDFRVPLDELSNMGLRIRLYGCEKLRRETMIGETVLVFSSINTVDPFQTMWLNLEPRSSLGHGDSMSDVSSLAPSDSGSSNLSLQHGGTPELMIGLAYNGSTGRLAVEIFKGSNFRNMTTKRPPDTYVKMTLTAPNGQEITRSKTSVRRAQPNPFYKEKFVFQVAEFLLADVSLMISVFVRRNLKRKEMIGWFTMGHTSSSEEDENHWTAMINNKGEQVSRWHALLQP